MSVIRRSATICTGCWQVVAIDGENNRERIGALCSHLAPMVEVVPSTDPPGAVEERDAMRERCDKQDAWIMDAEAEMERLRAEVARLSGGSR